ncbi:MAG: polysaccharide pyruvyl transferase family protein [Ruminococcus flavefaciens]|nr:polysaccharide pyruvyl transferase family protein [Ruminococcus flavefaciens]MCM1362128.1 polysaccharide pyruvyl transferase family protein [Clostridiales bacterium]MCM1435425.1 polysaccharide pyruvyl transferase family protein [Ruminococcus flavefaciens]
MATGIIFDTAICTSNLGDEIILDAICRNMKEVFDNNFMLRLSTHSSNFSFMQMMRNNKKINYCLNAEYKFVCGTNLISQKRVGKINTQWQIHPYEIPIFRNSILVGAGTTDGSEKVDFYAKYLYKKVLSDKYMHSVRDELTKRVIESLGFKAINTGCPTLWELTPEHCREIKRSKSENCIITVSGYADQKDASVDQVFVDIVKKNYNKIYAWIQTTEDEKYLYSLKETENIEKIYSLSKYREILRNGNVDYIGTRLHGGVFAMQNKVRSVVISIDHRAEGFHEKNNIPIIRRKNVESNLERIIHSDFETKIINDYDAINKFKSQFI